MHSHPANRFRFRSSRPAAHLPALLACFSLTAGALFAQQASSPSPTQPAGARRTPTAAEANSAGATTSASSTANDAVVLSPFEVRPEEDNGYKATSTLAGTRLRSDLKDLAASISV